MKSFVLVVVTGCSNLLDVTPYNHPPTQENTSGKDIVDDLKGVPSQSVSTPKPADPPSAQSKVAQRNSKVSTLSQVLAWVLERNQKIKSFSSRDSSFKSLVQQANLIPNPEIDIEAENVGGSFDGTDSAEFTAAVSQLIETGGKRSARRGLAQAEAEAFGIQARIEISEIIAETKVAYKRVIFTQSRLELAEKEIALNNDVVSTVKSKLTYGGILEVELTKALINLKSSRLRYARVKQELEGAKRMLAALWGGDGSAIGTLSGTLSIPNSPSEIKPFNIEESPFFEFSKASIAIAAKNYQREKTLSIPDLTLSAGYRRLEEAGDNTFVGAVSVPLSIFNRNQGSIASAASQKRSARQEFSDFQTQLKARLVTLQERLTTLLNESRTLESSIIPDSKKSLRQATKAYKVGRVNYLDLLDSQKVFIQSQERAYEVLMLAIEAQVELQKIMGTVLKN